MDKPNFLEFWVKMAKITLKAKVNDPYFQYQAGIFHDACLVQIWWFQPKSVIELSWGQSKFPRILSQNGQNDFESQGQWPLFSMPAENIPGCMHVWCKFDDNSSNLWRVIVRTRYSSWTDGWKDRQRQRQYPFGLKVQGVIDAHECNL